MVSTISLTHATISPDSAAAGEVVGHRGTSDKMVSRYFSYFSMKIYCGYLLETLLMTLQHVFLCRNKKNTNTFGRKTFSFIT